MTRPIYPPRKTRQKVERCFFCNVVLGENEGQVVEGLRVCDEHRRKLEKTFQAFFGIVGQKPEQKRLL